MNSNKFWLYYHCLVIQKLNAVGTRSDLVVKSDMKFSVQLLLQNNLITLLTKVETCILHPFHLKVNEALACHDHLN